MGAFFANVHLLAPPDRADETHSAILECLRKIASENGLVPCDEGAKADRSFIVKRSGAWLGVYDQATESQDIKLLDDLAARLSVSARCPALAVLVHDSDHLFLRLFEDGQPIDEIECGKTTPKIERWSKVVPSERQEMLRASFARRDHFAEQTLAEIASILDIDGGNACTGYRYLTEAGAVPDAVAHLRFRLAVRPAYEQPAEGPPRLTGIPFMASMALAVGGALRATATARNEGGAGRNFYVLTHGPAIDSGLVEPEKVRVVIGLAHKGGTVLEAPTQKKALPNGHPCFLADFPEAVIPASHAGGAETLRGMDTTEAVELQMKAQIHSVVEGRAVAEGAGDLVVSLVCREARKHPAHQGFKLTVAPTPRKPLRGSSDDPSHYLALASPEAIVALAASTLSQADAAPIALEIVEKWSHLWPREITLEAMSAPASERASSTKSGLPDRPRSSMTATATTT